MATVRIHLHLPLPLQFIRQYGRSRLSQPQDHRRNSFATTPSLRHPGSRMRFLLQNQYRESQALDTKEVSSPQEQERSQ